MQSRRIDNKQIAIIGLACRLAGGVRTPAQFWEFVKSGGVAIRDTPKDRFDVERYFSSDPDMPGTTYSRHAGYVDRPYDFDADFFGISTAEALEMDPQQRWMLELCWTALEHAGVVPSAIRGQRVGIFLTTGEVDYGRRTVWSGDPSRINTYAKLGTNRAVAAGRISYLLGLQGPALYLDTSCSSALVAVHLAAQSLRAAECDLAIAGGVNLILGPEETIGVARLRALSPSETCRPFDSKADGYVRGEGGGVVVMKRALDAVEQNDRIEAILAGSSINNDGPSNGLTAPNPLAQEAAIRQALAQAGAQPEEVAYVEAHGTGTPLGDPTELLALRNAYTRSIERNNPLLVGSVKAQTGHLEVAAGIVGLIRAIFVVQNQHVPSQVNFEKPNPRFDWDGAQIEVPRSARDLPPGDHLVGINSFGISGTNAHVILASPPPVQASQKSVAARVLTLSGRTEAALRAVAREYAEEIARGNLDLHDACYTAGARRSHWNHRLAVVGTTEKCFTTSLADSESGRRSGHWHSGEIKQKRGLVFLFPGQGAWRPGVGADLYRNNSTYKANLDACISLLSPDVAKEVKRAVLDVEAREVRHHPGQLAHFVVLHSMARMWMKLGLTPGVVLGHSLGEHVAAVIAGVMSLEDGLKAVEARGRLFEECTPRGAMLAVGAGSEELAAILPFGSELFVSGINGPTQTVLSGTVEAIVAAEAKMKNMDLRVSRLQTYDTPGHSPLLEPMRAPFREALMPIAFKEPKIKLISTLTGRLATADIATVEHWLDLVEQPVQFADALATLANDDVTFLEVGPGGALSNLARHSISDAARCISTLADGPDGDETPEPEGFAHACARLYCAGYSLDWAALYDSSPKPARVPTYVFEATHFELPDTGHRMAASPSASSFPGQKLPSAPCDEMLRFEGFLSGEQPGWMGDYAAGGITICPSIALLAALSDIAFAEGFHDSVDLSDVSIEKPITFDQPRTIHFAFERTERRLKRFSIHSRSAENDADWTQNVAGLMSARKTIFPAVPLPADVAEPARVSELYERAEQRGMPVRTALRRIQSIGLGSDGARVLITKDNDGWTRFSIPEIDAVFQSIGLSLLDDFKGYPIPIAIERLCILHALPLRAEFEVVSRVQSSRDIGIKSVDIDARMDGELILQARGVQFRDSAEAHVVLDAAPSQVVKLPTVQSIGNGSVESILEQIKLIARPVAGRLMDSINDDDALTARGFDSLALTELRIRLKQKFGRGVPVSLFAQGASLRGLAAFYNENGGNSSAASARLEAGPARRAPHASLMGMPVSDDAANEELIIQLRDGPGSVVALVHPVGGDVLCYSELAAAWPGDSKIVGVRHPNGDLETASSYRSLKQLAALYRLTLVHVLGRAPDTIGGWSFGGAVAQEMARQWEAEGTNVSALALIDAPLPNGIYANRLRVIVRDLGQLQGEALFERLLSYQPFLDIVDNELGVARLRSSSSEEMLDRIMRIHAVNTAAYVSHSPMAVQAPVSYALARLAKTAASRDVALTDLRLLGRGAVKISEFEDDHFSIVQSSSAMRVTRFLAERPEAHIASAI